MKEEQEWLCQHGYVHFCIKKLTLEVQYVDMQKLISTLAQSLCTKQNLPIHTETVFQILNQLGGIFCCFIVKWKNAQTSGRTFFCVMTLCTILPRKETDVHAENKSNKSHIY